MARRHRAEARCHHPTCCSRLWYGSRILAAAIGVAELGVGTAQGAGDGSSSRGHISLEDIGFRGPDVVRSIEQVLSRQCTADEKRSSVHFVFPRDGQQLDSTADLSLGRNLLIRFTVKEFKLQADGQIILLVAGYNIADIKGQRKQDDSGSFKTMIPVGESNIELFGMTEGTYELHAALIDNDHVSRECWKSDHIVFTIEKQQAKNRTEALLKGLQKLHQTGGRHGALKEAWLPQPHTTEDFGYVVALWGDSHIDNALAWAAGLEAVGSTFQRYCMVILELMHPAAVEVLERCCCKVLPVELIRSPWEATRGKWSRYELVLTKLRIFQLGQFGLRKVVLMDADMLVLQNIDELFWTAAPAMVPLPGSVLGRTTYPKLSAGLMVIEPSEAEFEGLLERLKVWVEGAKEDDVLHFIEQDLLDMYWDSKTRPKWTVLPFVYNVYPEMLDTFPFLAPEDPDAPPKFPLDHGVKVLHLWHWYNPMLATTGSARQSMQLNARMKHKMLWNWYELWWRLHQVGMAKAMPDKFPTWLAECQKQNIARYGSDGGQNFRPILQGFAVGCMHMYGGLAW